MLLDRLKQYPIDFIPFSEKKTVEILTILEPLSEENGIETKLQKAHFFGQLAHESGWFKHVVENLNYSQNGLRNVFGKYFPTDDLAKE